MTMRAMSSGAVLVMAWAACGGRAEKGNVAEPTPVVAAGADAAIQRPVAAPPAGARVLAKDETFTSASGATFVVAMGWSVAQAEGMFTITGPEGDVTMTYLEVEAPDGKVAIEKGWERARPGFALTTAQTDAVPGRDGWDAMTQIVYATPAAEKRLVIAAALGKGKTWRVFLLDGATAAVSRRGAQLGTTIASLKAPGVKAESWAGQKAHVLDAERLAQIDAFVEKAMAATGVPGAAMAIVQGGKVVHERGYGVRELGKKAKVGPHTLFLTGSTGKSLVTLMMARGVDAGVFTWDTPVTQILPSFRLGDAEVTRSLLVHHMVCACTGMPRQDMEMLFEYEGVTPEMRMDAMKSMSPTTRFGEVFQYSNFLVMSGGYIAGHAFYPELKLGAAFDQAMQKQVFDPLGMKDTTYDFKRTARVDHATPHGRDASGEVKALPLGFETWVSTVRPAGGQWSSVHDYTRVLLLELSKGKLDGTQVVSEANLMARRKPQVKISEELSYGLGLVVGTMNGVPVVTHDGGTAGFATDYFWLPDHDVGVVIVSNIGEGTFMGTVRRKVLELLFDAEAHADEDLAHEVETRNTRTAELMALLQPKIDPAWTGPLAGAWSNPQLGKVEVQVKGAVITVDAGEWRVPAMEKVAKDGTRSLALTGAPAVGIELVPEEREGKRVLVLRDEQKEYVFEKVGK